MKTYLMFIKKTATLQVLLKNTALLIALLSRASALDLLTLNSLSKLGKFSYPPHKDLAPPILKKNYIIPKLIHSHLFFILIWLYEV